MLKRLVASSACCSFSQIASGILLFALQPGHNIIDSFLASAVMAF
jgi:hypothetical protein